MLSDNVARETAQMRAGEKVEAMIESKCNGQILTITFNAPERLNALTTEDCIELSNIWDIYEADDNLRVAVITGTGRAFCAGHDLADDFSTPLPDTGWGGLAHRQTMNKPIIAAVNGLAVGGGWEIALACDLVIADETARFGLPEALVGYAALGGGASLLPLRMPWHMAMRYLLTGEIMDVHEAQRWGLVSDIAPLGTSLQVANRYAQAIIAGAPVSIKATKSVARAAVEPATANEAVYQLSMEWFHRIRKMNDAKEGEAAFREKRKPNWTGT